jgi:hypothetical protein
MQLDCPHSHGPASRGGAKHTRQLKSAWRRGLTGNPQARSWLGRHKYPLPPSPAEQALAAKRALSNQPTPAIPTAKPTAGSQLVWATLKGALNHWEDCPHCYSTNTTYKFVDTTDVGRVQAMQCKDCEKLFKRHPNSA